MPKTMAPKIASGSTIRRFDLRLIIRYNELNIKLKPNIQYHQPPEFINRALGFRGFDDYKYY